MMSALARLGPGAVRRAGAVAVAVVSCACGGADVPTGPPRPSPSPSVPATGGAVLGRYLLQVTPGPGCGMNATVSFPMIAAAAGASPYPGVQVLVAGGPDALEVELRSQADTLTGGFGTTESGVLADEAMRMWIRTIGTGAVLRAPDRRGQVTSGRMAGYVALGHALGPEGSLGACDAVDHAFTLRAQ